MNLVNYFIIIIQIFLLSKINFPYLIKVKIIYIILGLGSQNVYLILVAI